jgi:hypothetical protein
VNPIAHRNIVIFHTPRDCLGLSPFVLVDRRRLIEEQLDAAAHRVVADQTNPRELHVSTW